jgi:hypothetical protein|nr:MAG TPA: helix-turn-helix domain protein [Caudoviricetes sp.]
MKFKSLGEFLKYFSETREYTYEYIGLKTGLKKATISHYVNGRRNPSKEFIESFLKEFKLTKEEKENFLLVAELGKTDVLKDEIAKYNITNDERVGKLTRREKLQYKDLIEGSRFYFNDENISEEDKDKLMASVNEAYFEAKKINKEKYKKNKK